MLRKAQAEFAVILGLVIIATVVAIYAYSGVTLPSMKPVALTEGEKAVDAYVRDAIRAAVMERLGEIYRQGGYIDTSGVRYTSYGGNRIPFWQRCGTVFIPDVESNFEVGVENILQERIPAQISMAGERVVFDKSEISADAQFFENKVVMNVMLPATMVGGELTDFYRIEIPTTLGRIYSFAKDFARFQARYRALEYNLMKMIYLSNPDYCWLPTEGAFYESRLSKSWFELRNCMQEMIYHTLAHTYEWEKPYLVDDKIPVEILHRSWIFQIVKSSETGDDKWGQYKELNLNFYYGGDEKELTRYNPEFLFHTSPDPVRFRGESFPMIFDSIGPVGTFDVKYDVSFPVIVSVFDSLLDREFRFTLFVNIRGNEKADDCGMVPSMAEHQRTYYEKCYSGATEEMDLKVINNKGDSLYGVNVRYTDCDLGATNDKGELRWEIPKLTNGKLELESLDGSYYSTCMSSVELEGSVIIFPIKKGFDINFYLVELEEKPDGDYRINSIGQTREKNITVMFTRLGNPCMNSSILFAVNKNGVFEGATFFANRVDIYPESKYDVVVSTESGEFEIKNFMVDEDEEELYVYAPVLEGGEIDSESVEKVYQRCNMHLVSTEQYRGVCPL